MTDSNQQTNPSEVAHEALNTSQIPDWKNMFEKGKSMLKPIFLKLYAKKLVFWSICSFLGIVLLIIILGLLFGKKSSGIPNRTPSPVPFILATPTTIINSGILSITHQKLNKLRIEVDELDVKQGRLRPPTLNFEVRF